MFHRNFFEVEKEIVIEIGPEERFCDIPEEIQYTPHPYLMFTATWSPDLRHFGIGLLLWYFSYVQVRNLHVSRRKNSI